MNIAKTLLLTLFTSAFLYLEYFNINIKILDTIFALMAIFALLTFFKKELFWGGFLTGVLWFWWLGYSFVYYELSYLIPFVIIGVGTIYGLLFLILGYFNNIFLKGLYLFILTFINPFGFNWFKLELLFIDSFLGTSKLDIVLIIFATVLLIFLSNQKKLKTALFVYTFIIVCTYFLNIYLKNDSIDKPNLKIYLNSTNIDQEKKWDENYKKETIIQNLQNIQTAIENNYDLIIFPETAFALVLNKEEKLKNYLKEKSKDITILTGALNYKDDMYYNSSFLFKNGQMQIANKVVLVPFGEAVPLPQKLRDIINNTFYNGAKDYEVAKKPTSFDINEVKFRNAICYEATTDKIFENLDTNYMIAISNNAWFTPSIQPTLQKLLFKYYSRKYNVMIFSVSNKSKSFIITPTTTLVK